MQTHTNTIGFFFERRATKYRETNIVQGKLGAYYQ